MSRLCLYYKTEPERDRWLPGDRHLRPFIRRIIRGKRRPGGIDRVFINLCKGLNAIGQPFIINLPFEKILRDDLVAILGRGRHCLDGYRQPNPIVAGIGLMTHPSEWPTLCSDYPVVRYLQHSAWCDAVYRPYFGERCAIWPVGIDTGTWRPAPNIEKRVDFLVYDKIAWDRDHHEHELLQPALACLRNQGLNYEVIRYGAYTPEAYHEALSRARALLFFSPHESQGIAYQEAMATDVPVLAWDPGQVMDPARFSWGQPDIKATSVPYFDGRCGRRFRDFVSFKTELAAFLEGIRRGEYRPREYMMENLTLEQCAGRFVTLCREALTP